MPSIFEIFFELLHGDQTMDYFSDDEDDCPVEEIVLDEACGELLLNLSFSTTKEMLLS